MSYNDFSNCIHQSYSNEYCLNCGALYISKVFALKHPKYTYRPELNPRELYEKMINSSNNDITISQLNKKYIEKRHDIIQVLKMINNRLNFNSQTLFLAICYLDEVVFKCNTMTKTSEFLLIGLSCLLIAAKFNENDPNVPEMKKFIVVFCELIKYRYRYRLEDLRIGEIFVLKQLDYKMNYYSIYHYIVFFFAHGLITEKMLNKHMKDLTQSTSTTTAIATASASNTSNGLKRKRVIKVLEQIYVQAREILDVLLESEEYCVFGKDNHIAAIVLLKIAIENIISYETIPKEDDLLYLAYGIDETCNSAFEEVRKKVKAAIEQRNANRNKEGKDGNEVNAGLMKSNMKGSGIKEKKTFDLSNHKTLQLCDYESQNLLTNNAVGMTTSQMSKGRDIQPQEIRGNQYELQGKECSNIENVREELFAITSKMRKRACSSTKEKDKNKEQHQHYHQIDKGNNNMFVIDQEGLPMKYQSSNQVNADIDIDNNNNPNTQANANASHHSHNHNHHNHQHQYQHIYNNYNQPQLQTQQQQQQNQKEILDKTKYIFNQTRNSKKQIILYSGSALQNQNINQIKPIELNSNSNNNNTPGLLYKPNIDPIDNQSPSTIIINNNININIQDKHLSSSQLLKKGDEQLYSNDLRRSNHFSSKITNNFGTYYNYSSGSSINGMNANQFNYYAMNQGKYGSSSMNMNISGNRYGNIGNKNN